MNCNCKKKQQFKILSRKDLFKKLRYFKEMQSFFRQRRVDEAVA